MILLILEEVLWWAHRLCGGQGPGVGEVEAQPEPEVKIAQRDLDEAFVFPWAFLLGWFIFAISYFFDPYVHRQCLVNPLIDACRGNKRASGWS